MPRPDMLRWADTTGIEVLRCIEHYSKTLDTDLILEARHGVVQLHALIDEICDDCVARNMIV